MKTEQEQKIMINDARDSDYIRLENINAAADQCIEHLSDCCCNSCQRCMRAVAVCAEAMCTALGDAAIYAGKKIAEGTIEGSKVVILPPARTLDRIVRGPNKNDGWELPKDIAMFAVNPIMTMAEIFMKANGDLTLIPLQPALARAFECVDLVTAARKSHISWAERVKRTTAGLTGLVFAGYAALYAMTLADLSQDGTLNQLIPAMPPQMIEQLHLSTWHALQWAIAGFGGYIMTTNGYIFGKDLVLDQITHALKSIQTDIKVDAIIRHLLRLEKMTNPQEKAEAQAAFQAQLNQNKGLWHWIDVVGRTIEHVLSFAVTTPIRIARDTAENLTAYKPVIGKLQYYKTEMARRLPAMHQAIQPEEEKEPLNPEASPSDRFRCCAKTAKVLTGCFFHSPTKNDGSDLESKTYDQLLEDVKNSYYSFAPATLYNGREKRLANDVQSYYYEAMRLYQQAGDIKPPFGTRGEPTNPEWKTDALSDPVIVAFLEGDMAKTDFPEDMPVTQRVFHYNQRLFQHYNKSPSQEYSAPAFSA